MKTEKQKGVFFAVCAFLFWGLAPIYFKQVSSVAPLEILAHRIIWSVVVLIIFLAISKQFDTIKILLSQRKKRKYILLSSLLVSSNWLIFIYAVSINQILEASLGYFVNPLISILFAYLFFHEKLSKYQFIAIMLALFAVLLQVYALGTLPSISIGLAITFALYGAARKKLHMPSLPGLFVETLLILPLAIGYLGYLFYTDNHAFAAGDTYITIMLSLAGIVTVLPLLWFNAGTIRLKLGTIGMLQYIGPSVAFLVAVIIYDEVITATKLLTFVLIWIALVIYSFDIIRTNMKK